MTHEEQLLDYRRTVTSLYTAVRNAPANPHSTWLEFRRNRDALFRMHPQSALSETQKGRFGGLRYFEYDPALRFEAPIQEVDQALVTAVDLQDDGAFRMRRFGQIHLTIAEQPVTLSVYWIMGYGGGIFVPFGDLTNRHETYGGGRYLLDTIKGVDLGHNGPRLIIDFNYAYNPSCAYNVRWVCPLAPAENRLPVAISAGEMNFGDYLDY